MINLKKDENTKILYQKMLKMMFLVNNCLFEKNLKFLTFKSCSLLTTTPSQIQIQIHLCQSILPKKTQTLISSSLLFKVSWTLDRDNGGLLESLPFFSFSLCITDGSNPIILPLLLVWTLTRNCIIHNVTLLDPLFEQKLKLNYNDYVIYLFRNQTFNISKPQEGAK